MALIDRIFHDDVDSNRNVSNHAFSAAVWFWAKGDLTRAQVIAAFEMTAADEVQLDELETHYQSLTADQKLHFHSDLEGAGVLAEQGFITKTKYKALLGLT
jgi:hypothetical protein